MYRNDPKDNGFIELIDCSLGKASWEEKKKSKVWTNTGGKKVQAIMDTGCAQMLIWADLTPLAWAPDVTAVWRVCLHGQPSTYL